MKGKAWGTGLPGLRQLRLRRGCCGGLSDDGIGKVKAAGWDVGQAVGNADWAQKWIDAKDAVPDNLSPDDAAVLNSHRDKLMARVEVARSIATATNVPDSLLSIINKETGNMVQDGRLHRRSEQPRQRYRPARTQGPCRA